MAGSVKTTRLPWTALAARLTNASREYAIHQKGGLPRGFQTGVASIPVLVCETSASAAIEWVRQDDEKHWAALDLPVIIERSTRSLAYRDHGGRWGSAYRPLLHRIIRDDLAAVIE